MQDDLRRISQAAARLVSLVIVGNDNFQARHKRRLEKIKKGLEARQHESSVAMDCEAGLKAIEFLQHGKPKQWQARELWYLLGGIVERVDVRLCSKYWQDGAACARDRELSKRERGDAERIRERREAIRIILSGTDTRFIEAGKKLAKEKNIPLHKACAIVAEKHPDLYAAMHGPKCSPVEGLNEDGAARKIQRMLSKEYEIKVGISTVKADVKKIIARENARILKRIESEE